MTRKHMDWSGNIVEAPDRPEIETVHKATGTELDLKKVIDDPFAQHMANIDLDEGDRELVEGACQFEATNLFECPNFFALEDEDTPEVVECGVCGRFDWKKKQSVGKTLGGEKLV